MPEVILAKSAGFCYGVKRAVEMAQQTAEQTGGCWMLGDLIHNTHVVEDLARRGIRKAASPSDLKAGDTVVIRSHGELKSVLDDLEGRGVHCDEIAETQGGFFIDPAKRQLVAERLPKYQSIQFPGI